MHPLALSYAWTQQRSPGHSAPSPGGHQPRRNRLRALAAQLWTRSPQIARRWGTSAPSPAPGGGADEADAVQQLGQEVMLDVVGAPAGPAGEGPASAPGQRWTWPSAESSRWSSARVGSPSQSPSTVTAQAPTSAPRSSAAAGSPPASSPAR